MRTIPICLILLTLFWHPLYGIKPAKPGVMPVPPELESVLQDSNNWWMQSSWHFQVYGRPLSVVYEDFNRITDSLETFLEHIKTRLKIRDPGLIQWYGLPEPLDKQGSIGKAYPEFGIVLSCYTDSLRHYATKYVTHAVLYRSWGDTRSIFMHEGLAVMLEGAFGLGDDRKKVDTEIRQLSQRGAIPPIAQVASDFFEYPESVALAVSGSFLEFLLERWGTAPMKGLYILAQRNNLPDCFEKVYRVPLSSAEQEWRQWLK